MSVEIEVGLENAGKLKVSPVEGQNLDLEPEKNTVSSIRTRLIIGGIALLAVVFGLYLYFHNRESTDDAQVDGHITPIAAKVYGRVSKVLVNDNQQVKAGQVIVQLERGDYQAAVDEAKANLALAESEARSAGVDVPRTIETAASDTSSAQAQLAGAQADLLRAQASYDQAQTADLAYAQANVDKSRADAQLAQADLARYLPLMEKGEISKQQYDAAKANADATASADIKRVAMRSADAQAKLAKVDQARAQLAAAELNLSYCDIVAPVDGVATHKQVEAGQVVQQGQGLMVIVPLQDVWVTANFKETQLRKMRPGQKAYIEVDTYGKTFTGHVDSIAGATGAVVSLLPPENATGNFVKVVQRIPVKILLDPIPANEAVLRPGMNVVATVITK